MNVLRIAALCLFMTAGAAAQDLPAIFPQPESIAHNGGAFTIDDSVPVLVPRTAGEHDLFLARTLVAELSDRSGKALSIRRVDRLPAEGKYILLGDARNPLVRQSGLKARGRKEGYQVSVTPTRIVVAGDDEAGTFYGLQSLRQLITPQATVPAVTVADAPRLPVRGLRLYVPGPEHIPFFKRFIRDFAALYKFNTIILEMNAVMRFDRHPELNAGWVEFARDLNYTRRDRPFGPNNEYQDSAHHDAGDGQILEKEDVADLVAYLRRYHFEVIPEIPSLTHSYYLLTRHRELAEIPAAEWPDTYCPLNPASYDLVFDVFDEYIDVIKPRIVHIGHDEWRMPVDVCERCKGKDYRELFIQDVNKIYGHLRSKNVRVAMWGDHLLESVRGVRTKERKLEGGYTYHIPGGLTREQVRDRIPKDILIFNWFWDNRENDLALQELGFEQVYGNLTPAITRFSERSTTPGLLGGAASSWAATIPLNFGKDLLSEFLGTAEMLWSADSLRGDALQARVQEELPGIRRTFRGFSLPSEDGEPLTEIQLKQTIQVMTNVEGSPSPAIPIGKDVSSLIFLHAAEKPGTNEWAYHSIANFDDSAELLGWYEVVYEDGFRTSIPVRYGVNIAAKDSAAIAYQADAVPGRESFYRYEWRNPRFGKPIASVTLHGVRDFHDWQGKRTPPNRVFLRALAVTEARDR